MGRNINKAGNPNIVLACALAVLVLVVFAVSGIFFVCFMFGVGNSGLAAVVSSLFMLGCIWFAVMKLPSYFGKFW